MSTPFPRKLATGGNGAEFLVEIALGIDNTAGQGVWAPDLNEALWDEGLWNGSELYWVDVTSRMILAQFTSGRDRWEQRFRTGAGTFVLDNTDGVFNPDGGRIGDLRFRPGRWIRVSARINAEPFISMWVGYIDTIEDVYSEGAGGINARIHAYDHMGNMVIDNPPALETPVPEELSSDRVERILDLSDWDPILRDIETGFFDVQSSDLAGSRLEEVQITADSEGGAFYVSKAGLLTFRNRDYLESPRSATPQFTIGDPSGGGVQVGSASTDWSTQRVSNDVRFARRGGTEQRVTDDASISLYQRRTFQRLNLENADSTDVLFLANRFLEAFRFDHLRIDSLSTIALDEDSARELLEMELADRVRVTIRTLQDWSYTMEAWINRFTFVVSADDWDVTMQVDNVDRTDPFDRTGFDDGFDDEGFGN